MWAVVVALGATYGLMRLAAARPEMRKASQERRLARLERKIIAGRRLTRDEAEDGAYLSRVAGKTDLERQFRRVAEKLKHPK